MSRRLEGQTAWISGGASGIGAATARLFAAEGAQVLIADVQAELGRHLEALIRANGGTVLFSECDVANEEQVRTSLSRGVDAFGGLQILVNCAGIVHVKPLHEYSAQEWDQLMAVNLRSIFFSIKHAIGHLRRNPRSYMVNIGSISSYVGQAGTPAYTASKGAVLLLSQSIALDYAADGLRCNCVCPGITDTPMLRHHLHAAADPAETLAKRLHRVPLGRALTPDDVARTVLYLSCEDSGGVTGTSVIVDGGYLAAAEWETSQVSLPDDLS
ncbi:MAG TPA: SDR family NAD(P)-dependent oxidoreductase [Planctomycetaceae bacterium]|jgi:NAD(P)-dependent dehydrogenase (short-subunit alcohol dehydrogenase family)|nr:SDR family NAD(P)-dependent oxidoreductase [Planctomycetaceae bacterium]